VWEEFLGEVLATVVWNCGWFEYCRLEGDGRLMLLTLKKGRKGTERTIQRKWF
jgi:hypothetical protein